MSIKGVTNWTKKHWKKLVVGGGVATAAVAGSMMFGKYRTQICQLLMPKHSNLLAFTSEESSACFGEWADRVVDMGKSNMLYRYGDDKGSFLKAINEELAPMISDDSQIAVAVAVTNLVYPKG